MDRLERPDEGFTLLELVIAIALSAVVLLSASNLLINFGKFSSNVVKNETSLMGTALGTFEEIVGRIEAANEVTTPAAGKITIRVDTGSPGTPSNYADDTVYTYWKNVSNLQYTSKVGAAAVSATQTLANNITTLSFVKDATFSNKIRVTLEAQPTGGSKEHLETTAIMRARSAN